jgi:dethiobiotin synthetase
VIDLARQLDAEIILVCRNYLGCINHSLLSIDYLRTHHYKIKGLVLNGDFDPLVKAAIVNYANLPVLAEINDAGDISKGTIAEWASTIDTHLF